MRFVRILATAAALGVAGQANAFIPVAAGTATTDANGVIIIPLSPLSRVGHVWRNKFSWSSDIPVLIGIYQEYDETVTTRSYYDRSTQPPKYILGTSTTTHYSGTGYYGTTNKLIEGFSGPASDISNYTSYEDTNYMAYLIAKAAPNTSVKYTLKITNAPEPATWALMILGFGGIGAAVRRKRAGKAEIAAATV